MAALGPPLCNRRALLARLGGLGTAAVALLGPGGAAGAQLEAPLADSVRALLSLAVSGELALAPPLPILPTPEDRQTHRRWWALVEPNLRPFMASASERADFLSTVWYEAARAGLPTRTVLGVIQVESAFRRHAISSAGAMGYMQVMPFWTRVIGDGEPSRLFHTQTNLRFGCVILRHYLDLERDNWFYALGRYNGSRGRATYPDAVWRAAEGWA